MVILRAFLSAFLSGVVQGMGLCLAVILIAKWWAAP